VAEEDAKRLRLLSQTAEWQVYRTPECKNFSAEFRDEWKLSSGFPD